jgi:phosphopantetheinyl transferase
MRVDVRGKPYPEGSPAFNLSHPGSSWVVVAVRLVEPVGVDLEAINTFQPGLLNVVCSKTERAWILNQASKTEAFYQCWHPPVVVRFRASHSITG